ncbi:guanylate kinase-like isoform X2 [Euwallacea similis]
MHPNLPRPLVICGPSGSGKSTLITYLMEEYSDKLGFAVSHTTRNPRPGEIEGRHYYFTNKDSMKRAIDNGEFIETASFSGNMYGSSFKAVEDIAREGKIVVMDIDIEGVKQVKRTNLRPWCVFIKPPSLGVLRDRLVARKTESEKSLERRLLKAEEEIKYALEAGNFDKIIVNLEKESSYKELREFVQKNVLKCNQ